MFTRLTLQTAAGRNDPIWDTLSSQEKKQFKSEAAEGIAFFKKKGLTKIPILKMFDWMSRECDWKLTYSLDRFSDDLADAGFHVSEGGNYDMYVHTSAEQDSLHTDPNVDHTYESANLVKPDRGTDPTDRRKV